MTGRRTGLAVVSALVVLAIAGCNGDDDAGSGPTPFADDSSGTPSSPAESSEPATTEPTSAATTPPAKKALVIVDPGSYKSNAAVQGFTRTIQEFYKARQAHNPKLMNAWTSSIFYTDNESGILLAKTQGLVMRPPGQVVIRGVRKGPIANSTTVEACFGKTMAWWDPKRQKYTNDLPNGSPISMDMTNAGSRWEFYQARKGTFSCTSVRYPSG